MDVAVKTGSAPWTGTVSVTEEVLPNSNTVVKVANPAPASRGFFRVLTRSIGGDGPSW